MKKFLAAALFAFGTFALVSCGGSDGSTRCEDDEMDGCSYKTCVTEDGKAWYEYNGKKYNCSGSGQNISCVEAGMALYNDCQSI